MSSSPKNSSAVMLYFFFNQSAKSASAGSKPNPSIHSLVSSALKPFVSHFFCNSGVKFGSVSVQLVIMKYYRFFY